jgi:hypothetical protein
MTDEQQRPPSSADMAREAAINQAVSLVVYIGLALAINAAILKRDAIWRAVARVKRWYRMDPAKEREARAVAELRRDISAIEHSFDPRPSKLRRPPRGVYEGETR